jgi:hypothetical protein
MRPLGLVNLNNHSEKSGRDELSETIGIFTLYATIPGVQNVNLTKPLLLSRRCCLIQSIYELGIAPEFVAQVAAMLRE